MIEIQHLNKSFIEKGAETQVLKDINLTINDGDVFGIIGESGAGKSTLVRCINMLTAPSSGSVLIDGSDITQYNKAQLNEMRQNIGMIFQHFDLFAQKTVQKNVEFPLAIRHENKKVAEKRTHELLDIVGLADYADRYPSQLSGGQQQRVAIARALANNPKIMLCDEATSALDSRTTIQVLDLLKRINQEMGVTLVVITHALAVVEQICNRVAVIDKGVIVEEGDVATVFGNPQSDTAKYLLMNHSISSTLTTGRDE